MASRGQSVTISYVAWDTANNAGKTGDSANHTLRWVKDGTSAAPTNSASEVDSTNAPGVYKITLTASECTCDVGVLCGKSATTGVVVLPVTVAFEQLPTAAPGQNGGLALAGSAAGTLDALADAVKGTPGGRTVKEAYERADAAKAVADKLNTALEADGAVYRFTQNALEQAPSGQGVGDWTAGEKAQIRQALGLSGTAGATTGQGHLDAALARLATLLTYPVVTQAVVTAATQEIVRHRGDTVPIAFGVGRDLAGASLRFTVKRRATDPQAAALIAKTSAPGGGVEITDPAAGEFWVRLAAADTAGLLPDGRRAAFLYDVECTQNGEVETLFAGAFLLLPDVTTG